MMGKKKHRRRRWHVVASRVSAGAVGAEVGVYDGKMSRALFKLIPDLRLFMVDRWLPYTADQIVGDPGARMPRIDRAEWDRIKARALAAVTGCAAKIIQGDSANAAAMIEDGSLDFVFIDGDHSYEGCKRDILAWMPKVRPGGWLMGHDYGLRAGVTRAVTELGVAVELDRDKVWAVRL
jgi:hypothetical protein